MKRRLIGQSGSSLSSLVGCAHSLHIWTGFSFASSSFCDFSGGSARPAPPIPARLHQRVPTNNSTLLCSVRGKSTNPIRVSHCGSIARCSWGEPCTESHYVKFQENVRSSVHFWKQQESNMSKVLWKVSKSWEEIEGNKTKMTRSAGYLNHNLICSHHSPVNELIYDDNVSRLNFLPQWATGCGNQQMCTALFSQRPNVGLVIHIGRHYAVLSPVPTNRGKKLHLRYRQLRLIDFRDIKISA